MAVLAICLVGGISIYRAYSALQEQLDRDLSSVEKDRRHMLVERVNLAKGYVDFARGQLETRLRSELKESVDHAYATASHLVDRFGPTVDRKTLQDLVREALRPMRWQHGRISYFIVDLHGVAQLYPQDPSIEGTNVLTDGTDEERRATAAALDLAKGRGEGYLDWQWPNPSAGGAVQTKRGFIRLFKPLGWIIGAGEFLPNVEADLKKAVLARLDAVSYDDGGYLFVATWDGLALSKRPDVRGRNMWDLIDANGVKVVQELVARAKAGGGFVDYVMPDIGGIQPYQKISYVVGIPEWQWYIGTGTSLRDIERAIAAQRSKGLVEIYRRAAYVVLLLGMVVGMFVWLSRRLAVRVDADTRSFIEFFKSAATSDSPIAIRNLEFVEFEELARAANRMIIERVEVGEKLRESEDIYRAAFWTSPDAINVNRAADGTYVDINQGFVDLTGYSRDEVIGRTSAEIGIWADPADRDRLIAGLEEHGQVINLEAEFRLKDGRRTTALMSARTLDIEGVPHILSITRDISKLKEAEAALRESEELHRSLFQTSPESVSLTDLDGLFVEVNDGFIEQTGYSRDEVIGRTSIDVGIYVDLKDRERMIAGLREHGQVVNFEARFRRKDGRPIDVLVSSRLVNVRGVPHILAVNRDISELKEAAAALRESEELYRSSFQTNPESVVLSREDGLYVDINQGFTEQLGYSREEVIGRRSTDIGIWAVPGHREQFVAELRDHGQVVNLETRFRRKDGSQMDILISGRLLEIRGVPHILSVTRDISNLKKAEIALRESEEKYRLLVENQTDFVVKIDLEGRFLYVSPSFCEIAGRSEDELLGQGFEPMVYEDDQEVLAEAIRAMASPPYSAYVEIRGHTKNGVRWVAWQGSAVLDPDGAVKELIGVGRDIHDRKLADEAFSESQVRFRRAIENMPLIGVSLDLEGRVVFANDHFLALTGWAADDVLGRDWFELVLPSDQTDGVRTFFLSATTNGELGEGERHENEILTKDGSRLLVSWFNVLDKDAGGNVVGITSMGLDVTERTRAQRSLEAERRFIGTVLETLSDGVVACNAEGEIILFNRALREFHGFDLSNAGALFEDTRARTELFYTDGHTPVPDEELPLFRALRGESVKGFEMVIASEGLPRRVVSTDAEPMRAADGTPAGAVGIVHDVTEQKRTQDQLRHAQKMEAVGHLTGGIAHDFNNLLQIVLSSLQIIQQQVSDRADIAKWLDNALSAGWRGAELTQKLLSFSRKQALYPKAVDPNALISGMLDMLRRTLGEDIEIETMLDEDVPAIMIDPGGLENAIVNLAVNARAAMRDGGLLVVESRRKHLDAGIIFEDGSLMPGDYVEIAMTDSGCGMAPEVLERAFEPFFTTKDVGEGSGLGLSMVYGFARQSGGNVTIESQPRLGTTVTFLLPGAVSGEGPARSAGADHEMHTGSATVLVVEDDEAVRESTIAVIGMLGYTVLEAADGITALKILEKNPDIDLLFTDVVMPKGISGIELARMAGGLRSDLKVVLTSGYPEMELRNSGLSESEFRLLRKPYTNQELSAVLKSALAE